MNWKKCPKSLWLILSLTISPALHTEVTTDWNTHCLAEAIHQEARGETTQGQRAVAQVVMNRVNHPRFPKTICEVVFQKNQFSWTKTWNTWTFTPLSMEVAKQVQHTPINLKALWFHNNTVNPNWNYQHITTIGNHLFYK